MKEPGQMPLKRLYTIKEAGTYLGRSTWSVRRLVWKGLLPKIEAGGRVHIDLRDMDEFVNRNKVTEEDVA
jgi:excisionase family DNA binding protein